MQKIKVYSTPVCPYCNMLKSYLKEKGFEYEDANVAADQAAGEEMVKKSGQMGVPVCVITTDKGKEEVIIGFDKSKVNEVLGIKE